MDAQDRISEGWQVWLTPRQTRVIDALRGYEPTVGEIEHVKELWWIGSGMRQRYTSASSARIWRAIRSNMWK